MSLSRLQKILMLLLLAAALPAQAIDGISGYNGGNNFQRPQASPVCQRVQQTLFGWRPGMLSQKTAQDYYMNSYPAQLHNDMGVDLSQSKLNLLDRTTISRLNERGLLTPLMTIEGLLEDSRRILTNPFQTLRRCFPTDESCSTTAIGNASLVLIDTLQSSFLMVARDLATSKPVPPGAPVPASHTRTANYLFQLNQLSEHMQRAFDNYRLVHTGEVLQGLQGQIAFLGFENQTP